MIEYQDNEVQVVKSRSKILKCDRCGAELYSYYDSSDDNAYKEDHEGALQHIQQRQTFKLVRNRSHVVMYDDPITSQYVNALEDLTYVLCDKCRKELLELVRYDIYNKKELMNNRDMMWVAERSWIGKVCKWVLRRLWRKHFS